MNITVFGTGYVGLVTALCFAELGNHVLCVDTDKDKISKLKQGILPIFEPGLSEMLQRCIESGHIQFTTEAILGVRHGLCLFIAVGTPSGLNNLPDMQYIHAVANTIAEYIKNDKEYKIIIQKSTAPVGTVKSIYDRILEKAPQANIEVISNPEFLKEGAAIQDFLVPDRVVLGGNNVTVKAKEILEEIYYPICKARNNLIWMDAASAELTKYAANGLLATKISFINELANLAEKVGADIQDIKRGIGTDVRIGPHFIQPGCGYGGSCFGKDIKALMCIAENNQMTLEIISAVESVNEGQKQVLFNKINAYFNQDLKDKVFAIWGLAFKPNTDDMRDAPSLIVIKKLLDNGASIQAHDPEALDNARKIFSENKNILFCDDLYQTLEGAEALVILTEWKIYQTPDFLKIKSYLKAPIIFDGRNIYDPENMKKEQVKYISIGRSSIT